MRNAFLQGALLLVVPGLAVSSCFAQASTTEVAMASPSVAAPVALPDASASASAAAPAQVTAAARGAEEGANVLGRIGVGVKVSTLGAGAEAAFELTRHINLRGGINYFSYGDNFTNSGINYGATLRLDSGEAHFDYFIWRSFHLSPGLLIYNGNQLTANVGVPGGDTFTLSGTTYASSSANPVTGTGSVKFNHVDPSFMLGFGNLVPRSHHRISINFEMGAVYQNSPKIALDLAGSACDPSGANCQNVATTTSIQNNIDAQQGKYNHDVSAFRFYPVISLGLGFRL